MLLYINANSNPDNLSTTVKIANEFISEFKENNKIEVKRIDLINYNLPELDRDMMAGIDTEEVKDKKERREAALNDFINATHVVVAAPMWNLSYPAVLKTWIDAILVARKTFRYTSNGPVGLMGDKKVVFIQSSGGDFTGRMERNFAVNHFKAIMKMVGIDSVETVLAGGTARNREEVERKGIQEAVELAKRF